MTREKEDKFNFVVEDVFQLSNGQIVISGQIKSGEIKIDDQLLIRKGDDDQIVSIERMEIFAKPGQNNIGYKNDYVAFTVSGLDKSNVLRRSELKKVEK